MAKQNKTLEVGDIAPDFMLEDYKGERHRLQEMTQAGPTLLIFFRGTFCPDCRRQLGFLRKNYEWLTRLGVNIIAVAREHPEAARGYFRLEPPPPIPFLLDMDLKVSGGEYGMTYENDWKPEEVGRILVRPALFALDQKGIIRWRAADVQWDQDGSLGRALEALGIQSDEEQEELGVRNEE